MSHSRFYLCLALSLIAALAGCATPQGASVEEKRMDILQMRSETLATFYARMPHMREELKEAPGYGVFSGVSTHTIILASGNGFGVIRNNATGLDTFMRAAKLGGGLGAGIQNIRAVILFHDPQKMQEVLDHGWGVTGKAEATAKAGDTGGSGAMVITLPGMSIYRFTENGVMLGAAIEGVKVWKDDELN